MTLNIATIAGDGIGPEVTDQALAALEAAASAEGLDYEVRALPFGAEHYLETGHVLDDDDIQTLRGFDAIFMGAVGGKPDDTRLAGGIIEKGILLKLRFELDLYINLRPVKLYPGIDTPLANKSAEDIDFVCVRENTEDLYCGMGGIVRRDTPGEVATQTMLATRFGVERCLRYAFDLARSRRESNRGPGHLTLVHKTNVLGYAGDLWRRAFDEIASEYPDVDTGYHHVDASCMYLAATPEIYDVVVAPNMFGDIITDLGAAIAGGMGIAASGNLDPQGRSPSMFEPVHGSAPDIGGQGLANPIAAIDSMALLLDQTGRIKREDAAVKAGGRIAAAVQKVTPQFTGKSFDRSGHSTAEIGQWVVDAL